MGARGRRGVRAAVGPLVAAGAAGYAAVLRRRLAAVPVLEATDEVLVRRQEAARRPHPLQGDGRLLDGLQMERVVLASLRADADLVIDTSALNVHQLTDRIAEEFGSPETVRLRVSVVSFGFKYGIPVDADYELSLTLYRTNLEAIRGLEHPHQIEISVGGERVFLDTVGGERDSEREGASITDHSDAIDARLQVRVPVRAGTHTVGAAFIRKIGGGTQRLRPFLRSSAGTYDATGRPPIETMTVAGPFEAVGPGDTPSPRPIFVFRPAPAADHETTARPIPYAVAGPGVAVPGRPLRGAPPPGPPRRAQCLRVPGAARLLGAGVPPLRGAWAGRDRELRRRRASGRKRGHGNRDRASCRACEKRAWPLRRRSRGPRPC